MHRALQSVTLWKVDHFWSLKEVDMQKKNYGLEKSLLKQKITQNNIPWVQTVSILTKFLWPRETLSVHARWQCRLNKNNHPKEEAAFFLQDHPFAYDFYHKTPNYNESEVSPIFKKKQSTLTRLEISFAVGLVKVYASPRSLI